MVYAADSQVTKRTARGRIERLDPQRKVLPVKPLGIAREGGVVGYYGLAQVGGLPMDTWLRERIRQFGGSRVVEDFAVFLRGELNNAASARERRTISGLHIGGFEHRDGVAVPVMVFLRNTEKFDETTGLHSNIVPWWCEEHFPAHHADTVAARDLRRVLRAHEAQTRFPYWFRNGDLAVAAQTWAGLQAAVAGIVGMPRFDLPDGLDGYEALARALVRVSGMLYPVLYRGGAPLIGGRVITRPVGWP